MSLSSVLGCSLLAFAALRLWQRRATRGAVEPTVSPALVAGLRRELADCHPGVVWRGLVPGGLTAVLEVDGQETAVPLRRLMVQAEACPDAVPSLVARLVQELRREALDAAERQSFADVALSLFPQVRTHAWLCEQGGRFGDAALVWRPFGADLVVCYVIDREDSMTFVCRRHLQLWGRIAAEVDRLALVNLRRASPVLQVGSGRAPIVCRNGDGYDAARVLLVDAEKVEGLLFAVPDRDLLWIGRAGGRDALASLVAQTAEQAATGMRPVSDRLYVARGGRLEVVAEAVDQRAGRPDTVISSSLGRSKTTGSADSKPTKVSS